jgi:hypothetical protein
MMRALCGGHFTVVFAAPGATGLASWSSRTTPGRLACVRSVRAPGARLSLRFLPVRAPPPQRRPTSDTVPVPSFRASLSWLAKVRDCGLCRPRGGRRLGRCPGPLLFPGRPCHCSGSAPGPGSESLCDSELEQRLRTQVQSNANRRFSVLYRRRDDFGKETRGVSRESKKST